MAANDNSGKMSPELIRDLSKVLSETEGLMKKQEELIEKVLAGEKNIASVRIASLDTYFEKYSSKLNKIAKQYKDDLDSVFSALDKRLTKSFKTLNNSTGDNKTAQESATSSARQKQSSSSESMHSIANAVKEIRSILKKGLDVNDKQQQKLLTNILNTLKGSSVGTSNGTSVRNTNVARQPQTEVEKATGGNTYPIVTEISRGHNEKPLINYTSNTADSEAVASNETAISPPVQSHESAITVTDNKNGIDVSEEDLISLEDILKQRHNKVVAAENTLKKARLELEASRRQEMEDLIDRETEYRISKLQEVVQAEQAAQDLRNKLETEIRSVSTEAGQEEFGKARVDAINAKAEQKAYQDIEAEMIKYRADLEYEARLKNAGKLGEAEAAQIEQLVAARQEAELANIDERIENQLKAETKAEKEKRAAEKKKSEKEKKAAVKATDDRIAHDVKLGGFTKEDNFLSRMKDLGAIASEAGDGDEGQTAKAGLAVAIKALSSLIQQLDSSIDKIASYQGSIDTRLQGSNNKTNYAGSYWGQLLRDMMSVGAVTPFFKQETFANNIKTLVEKGISFDLKQRAFLMTIQEKIANTFNVADGTLLRLIRIQQEDSTAGRLGMESALNSFLNEMYETTEYLTDVAGTVRNSLQEMEALMSGAAATEVEYQVQKWMGSLYSVGMSQEAVQGIAGALGQIAAGQIDGLTGSNGAGNLLVMAANNSGKSISEILTEGLDADETNRLLQATVNYLADIAESTKGNNVVQQQIAGVFGVKASDLRAATNLRNDDKDSTKDIFKQYKTYDNLLNQLNKMAGTMYQRMSIGEMMTNVWDNGQYTLASSMASSPFAYLLYKASNLLEQTTGGIPLPFLNVMGFGVDLETTVADLMRVGALAQGVLGSIGAMAQGLSSSFNGQAMLNAMGIKTGSGLTVTPRGGSGLGAEDNSGGGAKTPSESGYVGNASSSDIKNSTIQAANDDKKKQMIKAKEEEPSNQVHVLNAHVIKIYELLNDVSKGAKTLRVKVDNYGLTGSANTGSSLLGGNTTSNSLGAIPSSGDSSLSQGGGSYTTNPSSGNYGGASEDSGFGDSGSTNTASTGSGMINLGGWTLM